MYRDIQQFGGMILWDFMIYQRRKDRKLSRKLKTIYYTSINDSAEKLDKKLVPDVILDYASDSDTYIRKNAYMAISRIYLET